MANRLNLNLLYALDAILNTRTLIDAGQRVFLTQPAMSLALRKLRDHFDDELVRATAGGRQLTPLALALRPRIATLLREADDIFNLTLDFDPRTAHATIRIAAPEAIEVTLLSRAVSMLLAQAPSIHIRLLPFDYGSVDRIFERGADLAVLPSHLASSRLVTRPLLHEEPVCLVWENHPGIGATMTVDQFRAARHITVDDTIMPHDWIGDEGAAIMAERNVVVRTSLHAMLPRLVIGTDLVAIASDWLSQHYASLMPLRVVMPPFAGRRRAIVAQWAPHRRDDPMIAWVYAGLRAALPYSEDEPHKPR